MENFLRLVVGVAQVELRVLLQGGGAEPYDTTGMYHILLFYA